MQATKVTGEISDSSLPGWPSRTDWILRFCFAMRCWALGDAFLWNAWERDSDLFGLMLFDWEWTESTAMRIENGTIMLMMVAGLAALVGPFVVRALGDSRKSRFWRRCELILLAFAVAWELAFAAAMTFRGGTFYSQLTIPAHTLRIAMPLMLLLITVSHRRTDRFRGSLPSSVLTVLRICIVVTFVAHGWKAWELSPEYTTLVLGGWQNTFGSTLSQSTAQSLLKWIGALDLAFAVSLMFTRWRVAFLYLVVWGALSALGRTVGGGWLHYPETLLRVAHAGGPLALFLEWRRLSKAQQLSAPSE